MSVDVEREEPLTPGQIGELRTRFWNGERLDAYDYAPDGMRGLVGRLLATLAQVEAERERLRKAQTEWAAAFDEWSWVNLDEPERWSRYSKASIALRAALAEPTPKGASE